jgi:hypothetical protein
VAEVKAAPARVRVQRSGADLLRLIVRHMDATRESFNDRFSARQLITIYSAMLASDWDFYPDTWTARQVREALRGFPPKWNGDEQPTYDR